ncbi:MAG: SMP-30/gluconolactonase/LRE family protein [Pseudomonadota bacterium]
MNEVRVPFQSNARYPDPSVEVLDDAFLALRLYSASVEQLASGFRWAEGPVWFGDGRYLLMSDIPNNRIVRWDDCSGATSVFRHPSDNANGHTRDLQGRLVSCEHLTRRITRTELDGRITVMADRFDGKRLNSPNDIVCAKDGAIWFTDPSFGINGQWEGEPAPQELPHAVYRLPADGSPLQRVIDDLKGPNGLAFSPDESELYVVESRAEPHRRLWAYRVGANGAMSHKRLVYEAVDGGALDGIAVDAQGHVWCGYGSTGKAPSAGLDGVRVIEASGQAIGHVHLPERCANVCFGGAKMNRLFMASSHSLYALYVNVQGAT